MASRWRLRFARRDGALLLIVLMCSGGSSAYSVLTHEEIVDLLWTDADPAPPAQAISRTVGRPDQGSPCLRLWRRGHPGPRLLPVRQPGIQQPGALRPQRRLCSRTAARKPGCQRVRLRAGRPVALCVGHRRPPGGQPGCRDRVSEAASEVWQISPVCAGQDGTLENGVRVRHGAGGEESLCLAAVPRFHRIPGVQAPAGAGLSRLCTEWN